MNKSMYKSRSMFQGVNLHSRWIYKTSYSLAVGRNIYKPVIWGDSARCVFFVEHVVTIKW